MGGCRKLSSPFELIPTRTRRRPPPRGQEGAQVRMEGVAGRSGRRRTIRLRNHRDTNEEHKWKPSPGNSSPGSSPHRRGYHSKLPPRYRGPDPSLHRQGGASKLSPSYSDQKSSPNGRGAPWGVPFDMANLQLIQTKAQSTIPGLHRYIEPPTHAHMKKTYTPSIPQGKPHPRRQGTFAESRRSILCNRFASTQAEHTTPPGRQANHR